MSLIKKYLIGNHKNNSPNKNLITELSNYKKTNNTKIIICPTLLSLNQFIKLSELKNIQLGVQCITSIKSNEKQITCTGETSINQLKELNIEYVIIGHNERRTILLESNNILEIQIQNCKENGFIPIFCIGQQLNESKDVLINQLEIFKKYFMDFSEKIIAYEPAFAIGTGKTPSIDEINESIKFIRSSFGNKSVSILYGGSVGLKNCNDIIKVCDGLLIGAASLTKEFVEIINKIEIKLEN